jgi:hypothetical protein
MQQKEKQHLILGSCTDSDSDSDRRALISGDYPLFFLASSWSLGRLALGRLNPSTSRTSAAHPTQGSVERPRR